MDDAEVEWRAHTSQIRRIEADTKKSHQEVLLTTNQIKEVVRQNNWIFAEKWEVIYDMIRLISVLENTSFSRSVSLSLKASLVFNCTMVSSNPTIVSWQC